MPLSYLIFQRIYLFFFFKQDPWLFRLFVSMPALSLGMASSVTLVLTRLKPAELPDPEKVRGMFLPATIAESKGLRKGSQSDPERYFTF